jgi:hypothetical protein
VKPPSPARQKAILAAVDAYWDAETFQDFLSARERLLCELAAYRREATAPSRRDQADVRES